jgi:hypothetical protein
MADRPSSSLALKLADAERRLAHQHAHRMRCRERVGAVYCERTKADGAPNHPALNAAEAALRMADDELRMAEREVMESSALLAHLRAAEAREMQLSPHNAVRYYGGGPGIPETPRVEPTLLTSAVKALGNIPSWVPRRICEEQIGDALEQIHRFARDAAPGWEKQVLRKVRTTKFWVLVNAIREVVSAVLGKKRA